MMDHLPPNAGTISADAGGTVAIGGDLNELASGAIAVTLNGTGNDQSGNHLSGQIAVAGAAALAGTLNIQLAPGYQPNLGDVFTIVTYASHTGTFSAVNPPKLPNNDAFAIAYNATNITLTVVQNQLAAGGRAGGGGQPPLTAAQVRALRSVAIQLWAAEGLTQAQLRAMRTIDIEVADLGGDHLGEYDGKRILLDDTADGYGWFIDPSPLASTAFRPEATDHVFAALANGPAAGHIDLLTVLIHELGHVAGLKDLTDASSGNNIMAEWLPPGVRRLA
jgi:hypothetical protein